MADEIPMMPIDLVAEALRAADAAEARRREPVHVTVIDPNTDAVIHSGTCQRMDLAAQAWEPHHVVIEGIRCVPDTSRAEVSETGVSIVSFRPKVIVTATDVKREARHRIERKYPQWKQGNVRDEGDPRALAAMREFIGSIRDASNRLEGMEPIPPDYSDDRWWPSPQTQPEIDLGSRSS